MTISRSKIQKALAYVHHHERSTPRPVAAREAIVTVGLNDDEKEILLNALHVKQGEIDALPKNWERPEEDDLPSGDAIVNSVVQRRFTKNPLSGKNR